MTPHSAIWSALDTLAARHGLSPSGLAKKAGMHPTAFNKSKRLSRFGNQRWPSTEAVDAVLRTTGETWAEFGRLVDGFAKENGDG